MHGEAHFPWMSQRPDLGQYLLSRLERLVWLRANENGQLNPRGLRLLDKAIYSTYCDLEHLGYKEQAKEVLLVLRTT